MGRIQRLRNCQRIRRVRCPNGQRTAIPNRNTDLFQPVDRVPNPNRQSTFKYGAFCCAETHPTRHICFMIRSTAYNNTVARSAKADRSPWVKVIWAANTSDRNRSTT
jgi:hypothetical protein